MVDKIKGYTELTQEKVDIVNANKITEERLLRQCNQITYSYNTSIMTREAHIAFTKFQEAFMWLNRAIFNPERIELPEDTD